MRLRKSNYLMVCFVCFIALTFSGCKYPKEYKQVKAGNNFTMMVPPWVKEETTLKPGAEFQYANRFRNFYAIGEALGKDSTTGLATVVRSNLGVLSKSMDKPVMTDSTDVTIGGLKGVRIEIFGNMSGEAIYFSEVVLEGKNHFYHLSVWTRTADRKLKFKDDIDRILTSFKEQ